MFQNGFLMNYTVGLQKVCGALSEADLMIAAPHVGLSRAGWQTANSPTDYRGSRR